MRETGEDVPTGKDGDEVEGHHTRFFRDEVEEAESHLGSKREPREDEESCGGSDPHADEEDGEN